MSLSDFGYDILRVLDEAEGYISAAEIADVLSEEGYSVVTGRVRPYLKHALGEYVERSPSGRWNIASPHHGKFSPTKRPAEEDGADRSSGSGNSQQKGHDELSRAIVKILSNADSPLPSDRIAEIVERSDVVSSSEIEFIHTQVNRRLYYELSAVVEKDDDNRWQLTDREYERPDDTVGAVDEKDDRANRNQKPRRVDDGTDTSKGEEANGQHESHPDQKMVDGERDGHPEKENQGVSSSEDVPQEGQDDLETSLSDFEREILAVLDREEGYIYTEDIAEALQREHDRNSELGRVQFYLENALDEYVVRNSSKGWNIASSYRGEFFSPKEEASNNKDSSDPSEKIGGELSLDSVGKLSKLVVQELSEADSSLKARNIAERISEDSNDISLSRTNRIRKEVNRRLYGELSSYVEKDDEHRWMLRESVRDRNPVPESETSQRGDAEKKESKTSGETLTDGKKNDAWKHESEQDTSEKTTPSGIAAEVREKLETAKQVAFLLDLADTPLSVSQLTSLIEARGREIKEDKIQQCLESTLSRFVTEERGGYCFKADIERLFQTEADEASPVEETEEPDSETKPVDAATRASVSGRRYEYVFEAQEMEGSSLFSSQIRGGTVMIKLNASHRAFDHFNHILDNEANSRIGQVGAQYQKLIRLLLVAWTEVEGDLSGRRNELAEEIRDDWGRALRFLLREEDTE